MTTEWLVWARVPLAGPANVTASGYRPNARSNKQPLLFECDPEARPPCEGKSGRETMDYINAHSSDRVLERLEEFEPVNVYRIHTIKNRTKQ